ncbi:hypothetical protein RP20_CCG015759, partial [Aedes albopictus]
QLLSKMSSNLAEGLSVQDVSRLLQRFGLADYLVFCGMLLVCIGIGILFGWKDHTKHARRQSLRRGSEALDYLVGGRRMKIFPVAMSLVASFNLDPTERTTIWAIFFGGGSFWIAKNSIHQMMIQRYLSLPSLADARKALILFTIGMICLMMTCFYNGLLIYATFHDCDPLTTKLAKEKDQLLPILVMKVFGDYPGMAGLFISGIFSASLSSLSTGLNSLAAVVLEDFVKPFLGFDLTERQTRYLMRGTVLLFGVIAVALVMVVEKLGTVLQLSMSLVPISLGPLLGVFLMGMLLPWINAKSALAGTCTGLLTMSYIVIRAQISIAMKEISHPIKPLSVAGCTYAFTNITKPLDETNHIPTDKSIHHVSFLFYTLIGVFSTCVSGIIYSFIFGRQNISEMDPLLVAPFLRSAVFPKRPTPITAVVHSFEKVDTKL